jgi:ubiquinol-cytochrome c reductase cytochrome c1 subunit
MRSLAIALAAAAAILGTGASSASASESNIKLPAPGWSFDGMLGTFDPAAQQRGFQVYVEVCSACHALKHVSYRNLRDIGFSEEEVKAIAAGVQVGDGPNDNGEMFERPGRPSDRFKSPFPNDNAARAGNNGALPPDLSLIVKAREGGADYVYGILTGYADAPADMKLGEGMNYNKYFPGHQIAMPAPLSADRVTYTDGTKATLEQEAHDVVTFLAWAAEPEMATRKQLGIKVMLFLIVLSGLLFAVKRKVWKDIH